MSATKFTPEIRASILAAVRVGNFREQAAARARITDRCLRKWLARGDAALERLEADEDVSDADAEYAEFTLDVLVG